MSRGVGLVIVGQPMIGWSREVGQYSILIVAQPMLGWSREVGPYSIRHSFQVGRGLEERAASRLRGSRPRYHRPSKKHRTRFCLDGTQVFHNFLARLPSVSPSVSASGDV